MGFIMKRFLTISSLFLICFQCQTLAAVHLSNDGTGQVGIVPFYSVVDGNETHLRIMNTSDQYKAVRVNVRTADTAAQSLYSLNVYLRPHDTWRIALLQRDGFITGLNTDNTCTLGLTDPRKQPIDWSNHIWETGFIEVIEMGEIDPATMDFYSDYPGEVNYCGSIEQAWSNNGIWSNNPLQGLQPATGGLQVTTELINVAAGFSFHMPVTMLADFYPSNTTLHTAAGSAEPNLSSGSKDSRILYDGDVVETTWNHGYEAVSALLMKQSVTNEFSLITEVRGQTEWTMTFPTLAYHLSDPDFSENFYYPNNEVDYAAFSVEGWQTPYPCLSGHTCSSSNATKIDYLKQHTAVYNFMRYINQDDPMNLSRTDADNVYIYNVNSESWRLNPQLR